VKQDMKKAMERVKATRVKILKKMVREEKTPTQISKHLGVSRQRVHQMAAEAGITLYYGDRK
jgi:DNA-directed RNA polymerase specialized sigma subunit